jgi:hypothetical protein
LCLGERARGREELGEWENGRMGEWENGRMGDEAGNLKKEYYNIV